MFRGTDVDRGTPEKRAGPSVGRPLSLRQVWKPVVDYGDRRFWLAIFAASALWGMTGACIKVVDWNPMLIVGVSGTVAAVFLWCFPFKGAPLIRDPGRAPEQLKAGISYFAAKTLYVVATRFIPVTTVVVLLHTSSVWLILITPFVLKQEKVGWRGTAAVAIAMAGLGWLLFDASAVGNNLIGLITGAGAGLAYAFCIVYLRQQSRLSSSTESFLIGHLATAALALLVLPFLAMAGAIEQPTLSESVREIFWRWAPLAQYLPIAALVFAGLFTAVAGILLAYATKRVKALPTTLVSSCEILFTSVLAAPLLIGELSWGNARAAALIIIAVAVSERFHGRKKPAPTTGKRLALVREHR